MSFNRYLYPLDWNQQRPSRPTQGVPVRWVVSSLLSLSLLGAPGLLLGATVSGTPELVDGYPLNGSLWLSLRGVRPALAQGVASASGLRLDAVRISQSESPVHLEWALPSSQAESGLSWEQGALRWAYRPDWTTDSGGPGQKIVLAQIVTRSRLPRGFRWEVSADGQRFDWVQFERGQDRLLTRARIQWHSNTWVAITANYGGADGTLLYTNGSPARFEGAPARQPSLGKLTGRERVRFRLGSDLRGQGAAQGRFDEVELFSKPVAPLLIKADLTAGMWAETQVGPAAVDLHWRALPHYTFNVRRRPFGAKVWTALTTNLASWYFRDTNVVSGQRYDYVVTNEQTPFQPHHRFLPVGLNAKAVHRRGTILVLVDETLVNQLTPALTVLQDDLVAEGWQVIQRSAPRHVDRPWSANPSRIAAVREMVDDTYDQLGDELRALYLVGHLPVPHSGNNRPDGHASRPFPSDGYYGDVERKPGDWTDTTNHVGTPDLHGGPRPIPNRAGDGVWDQRVYPSTVEIPVGRVDFANLPAFSADPPRGASRVAEAELLRRYLAKAHRYRRGELVFTERPTVYHSPPVPNGAVLTPRLAVRNSLAWFGYQPVPVEGQDPFREGRSRGYELACLFAYGGYHYLGGSASRRWSTTNLADPQQESSTAFFFVDGSYVGDYNLVSRPIPNVFLRAVIATPNAGLAAIWSRTHTGSVSLQGLGLGDTLGETWWSTLAHHNLRDGRDPRLGDVHTSLLGDPTLRRYPLPAVENLRTSRRRAQVSLRWQAATEPDTQYFVYRSAELHTGPLTLLTERPIRSNGYIDQDPLAGSSLYVVRPTKLIMTGCGSYQEVGPGALVRVER